MKRGLQGEYKTTTTVGEPVNAFVPAHLPPQPEIQWSSELRKKFDQALLALGRVDSITDLLPEASVFLYSYVRKEAVLSSMIEGTQSSLNDLLIYELDGIPGVPIDDVQEVSQYVAAMNHGLERLAEGFPLSLRLLREIHGILLAGGRGCKQSPGEFRRSQNWIGGTRPGNAAFVPPPPEHLDDCLSALELFLHDQPQSVSIIEKAALTHIQFETIHPFLDGNGRLGRLLITLLFCEQNVLRKPMLYLSLYFKTHRQYYYELLNTVRETGDWEAWLDFFADAVIETANQAVRVAKSLVDLIHSDQKRIAGLGRAASSALEIQRVFTERPVANASWICAETGLTPATVNKGLAHLVRLGIISEVTEKKRNRLFCYTRYAELLSDEMG